LTVEIVVARVAQVAQVNGDRYVSVRERYETSALRQQVREVGERWGARRKLRLPTWLRAHRIGIAARVAGRTDSETG